MYVTFEVKNNTVSKKYELSEMEMDILTFVQTHGSITFNNLKYGEKNPMDQSKTYEYDQCNDLINSDFLTEDNNAIYSYILGFMGTYFLKQQTNYY